MTLKLSMSMNSTAMEPGSADSMYAAEALEEPEPVRQPGEAVVGGRPLHPLGRVPLFGDVLDVRDGQLVALAVVHDRHPGARPHRAAVAAQEAAARCGSRRPRCPRPRCSSCALRPRSSGWLMSSMVLPTSSSRVRPSMRTSDSLTSMSTPSRTVDERHAGGRVVERQPEAFAGLARAGRASATRSVTSRSATTTRSGFDERHVGVGFQQHLPAVGQSKVNVGVGTAPPACTCCHSVDHLLDVRPPGRACRT